jgi:hypothetical protein
MLHLEFLGVAPHYEDREQHFVCWFWIDDVVAAALEAQPFGFNTHVMVDLSLAYNRQRCQSALDRLNQYGVAPITVQNLLYEWMAKTEDERSRKYLETLWQKQRTIDETAASAVADQAFMNQTPSPR